MTSAHISVIPEFTEKIELMGYEHYFNVNKTEITNLATGNEILFRGIKTSSGNNTANLKSLQGVTTWILDEAEELQDEDVFDKIDLSVRKKGVQNRVIMILNPTTTEHWIHKRFFEAKNIPEGFCGIVDDVLYIHTTYEDNIKHLDEGFLNRVRELKKTDINRYNHVILGAWISQAEGVIFSNWSIGDFDTSLPYGYGGDFGYSIDPDTLVKVAIDEKRKKIYVDEYLYSHQSLGTKELCREYKSIIDRPNDLIVADNSEGRLIDDLKKEGLNIEKCDKGPGSVLAGIVALQDYEIIVTPRSRNIIKELKLYVWNDKKSGNPIDNWNHCFIGSTLVKTINGDIEIKNINEGDLILTSGGYNKCLKVFNNGVKKVNKYLMQFDTFSVYLTSTKEHLIHTDKGWIEISKLEQGMIIDYIKPLKENRISCIKEKDISVLENGKKEAIECTGMYGNSITVKYLKDLKFTTKMRTRTITRLKTLSCCHKKNIIKNIKMTSLKKSQVKSIKNILKKLENLQKNGMHQKMESNGIENTLLKTISANQTCLSKNASNVSAILNQKVISKNFAQTNAKLNTEDYQELMTLKKGALYADANSQVINIQKHKLVGISVVESYEEQVYDIMVDNEHEYFANGVLVHNCIDAIRYIFRKMQTKPKNNLNILKF